MTAGDTQPTRPLPDWAPAAAPRRRRRAWPWIVAFAIVAGLAVAAWFAGEAIARSLVTSTIREQVVTRLALPADQQIDVDVPGPMIPQLIAGSLGDITVSSEDVPLGSFVGDITVNAQDVPIRGGEMSGGTATVTMEEEQLRGLMATVDGFPAETLALADPDVTMSTELALFGARFPVGAALTPSAVEGDIVLTPSSLQLAGADISAERLRSQFGVVADLVLKDWTVCIAEYIPAGLTLTSIEVSGDQVVAGLDIDSAIISDPALQANGTCDAAS